MEEAGICSNGGRRRQHDSAYRPPPDPQTPPPTQTVCRAQQLLTSSEVVYVPYKEAVSGRMAVPSRRTWLTCSRYYNVEANNLFIRLLIINLIPSEINFSNSCINHSLCYISLSVYNKFAYFIPTIYISFAHQGQNAAHMWSQVITFKMKRI